MVMAMVVRVLVLFLWYYIIQDGCCSHLKYRLFLVVSILVRIIGGRGHFPTGSSSSLDTNGFLSLGKGVFGDEIVTTVQVGYKGICHLLFLLLRIIPQRITIEDTIIIYKLFPVLASERIGIAHLNLHSYCL